MNEATWKKYVRSQDPQLRETLIVHYLYLVKIIVGRVASGLPSHVKLDDLYSSGVTGLLKAIEKFDPERNSKFETYAMFLIKGAIIDELRKLDWVPRSIHQKANKIAEAQQALQQTLGREPTDGELSTYLGVSSSELDELLTGVRPAILISLNADVMSQDEEASPMMERIADVRVELGSDALDRKECALFLEEAIAALPEQERKVLILYYYEELMLKEIGKVLGVSESRVSQIHSKALLKLRTRLKGYASERYQFS